MTLSADEALARALELAARGGRRTAPNPRVGAVVVREGEIVGEGWHRRAGSPHAEVLALRAAGDAARGATLYCTLEPCAHRGRTPPCVDAIARAGIRRVVVALEDPDPRVSGQGIAALAARGIEVERAGGALAQRAARMVEDYLVHRRFGRAFVAVKLAASLDGRIGDRERRSRWITSEQARRDGRALRERYGAILVGAETVLADDPVLLPPNLAEDDPPYWRAVLDGRLRVPARARLFDAVASSPVVVYTTARAAERGAAELVARGAEVVALPASAADSDRVEPEAVARDLAARGVLGLLVEGGGATAAAFVDAGVADKLHWYLAPRTLVDAGAVAALAGRPRQLHEAVDWTLVDQRRVGDDLALELVPRGAAR